MGRDSQATFNSAGQGNRLGCKLGLLRRGPITGAHALRTKRFFRIYNFPLLLPVQDKMWIPLAWIRSNQDYWQGTHRIQLS